MHPKESETFDWFLSFGLLQFPFQFYFKKKEKLDQDPPLKGNTS